MIKRDYNTLSACVDAFCSGNDDNNLFSDTAKFLLEAVLVSAFEDEEHRDQFLGLIDKLQTACDPFPGLLARITSDIGYKCYQLKSAALAEWVYRYALALTESTGTQNNLAYILRRHRETLCSSHTEIIDLLIDGVRRQEPCSLMNMALHCALNLGTPDDWHLADRLIKLIADDDIASVYQWWGDLAASEDPEGILVLYWLNRHNKLPIPMDQACSPWIQQIKDHYSNIPDWLFASAAEN